MIPDLLRCRGTRVASRDGKQIGLTTGASYSCQMEGCLGRRVTTRWPDGKVTHPCSKGMLFEEGMWRIQ